MRAVRIAPRDVQNRPPAIIQPQLRLLTPLHILFASTLAFLITYAFLEYASQQAKAANDNSRSSDLSFSVPGLPSLDPRISLHSDAYLEQPCEIGHWRKCSINSESEVVTRLRLANPPRVAKALMEQHSYSSAFHLFKELSLAGADAEIPQLASDHVFTRNREVAISLLRFATRWFLDPALQFVVRGREADALKLFRLFNTTVGHLPASGIWLAAEGLDATDLPILVDLFCSDNAQPRDFCELGILKSVAKSSRIAMDKYADFYDLYDEGISRGWHIYDNYHALPEAERNSGLDAYLNLWNASKIDEISLTPLSSLSDSQKAAWQYAIGAKVVQLSRQFKGEDNCKKLLDYAAKTFATATRLKGQREYFAAAANGSVKAMPKLEGELCGL